MDEVVMVFTKYICKYVIIAKICDTIHRMNRDFESFE